MPNTHETLGELFSDIADAIRGKTGGSAEIVADDFPEEIDGIPPVLVKSASSGSGDSLSVSASNGEDLSKYNQYAVMIASPSYVFGSGRTVVSLRARSASKADVEYYDHDALARSEENGSISVSFQTSNATVTIANNFSFARNEPYTIILWRE